MFEAQSLDFPFVASLPKTEKGKLAKLWDHFKAVSAVVDEKGMLVPQHLAAELLGMSRQRVWVLANEGKLEAVEVGGVRYVTEKSVIEYAKADHKGGRPRKMTRHETWRASLQSAKEIVDGQK